MLLRIWIRLLIPIAITALDGACFYAAGATEEYNDFLGVLALLCFTVFPLAIPISFIWAIGSAVSLTIGYRNGEDIEAIFAQSTLNQMRERRRQRKEEYESMASSLKARYILFRWGGLAVIIAGFVVCIWIIATDAPVLMPAIGATVLFVAGGTMRISSTPSSYNSNSIVKMIICPAPTTIEEVYRAFRMVKTPLGSPRLARFSTMMRDAIFFGPFPGISDFIYGYLNHDGTAFYIGHSDVDSVIQDVKSEAVYPAGKIDESFVDEDQVPCLEIDVALVQQTLHDCFKTYFETGIVRTPEFNEEAPASNETAYTDEITE